MDLMINPTITKFAQKVDGEITELKLGAKQEDAYAQIYQKGAESGGGKVENNKTATINVSTYSAPVEITPTSGKTSMKKATVTLSNIPSPSGVTKLYCYVPTESSNSDYLYTLEPIEETGTYFTLHGNMVGGEAYTTISGENLSYTVTNNVIVYGETEYERYSSEDISLV